MHVQLIIKNVENVIWFGHFESKCLTKQRHSSRKAGRRNPYRSLERRERRQRLNQIEVEEPIENESSFKYDDIFFYALTAGANFEMNNRLDYNSREFCKCFSRQCFTCQFNRWANILVINNKAELIKNKQIIEEKLSFKLVKEKSVFVFSFGRY